MGARYLRTRGTAWARFKSLAKTEEVGGRDRDRTGDPLLAKQVLSQLSYTPTAGTVLDSRVFVAVRKLRTEQQRG
jgi:hypothetical protein